MVPAICSKRTGRLFGGSEEDPLLPVLLLTFRQKNRSHTGSSFLPDWKISVSLGGRLGLALSPLGCIINRGIFQDLLFQRTGTSRQRSLTYRQWIMGNGDPQIFFFSNLRINVPSFNNQLPYFNLKESNTNKAKRANIRLMKKTTCHWLQFDLRTNEYQRIKFNTQKWAVLSE